MKNDRDRSTIDWGLLTAVTAFAIAMGHVEGVVVVYIREILGIIPAPDHLNAAVIQEMPAWLVAVEQTREAATIIMLVALAIIAGRTARQSLGVFLYSFGVWDIMYYVALKAMLGWPASLSTMDCLFLIPEPWYTPVWVPVSVSCVLIILGVRLTRTR